MTGHRKPVVVLVLIGILAVGSGGFAWWRSAADETLPVNGAKFGTGGTLSQSIRDFALGMILIERPGAEIAVLEVKPRTSANVEFLGAFTVWPRAYVDNEFTPFTLSDGFPPIPSVPPAARHPLGELVPAAETAHIPAGDFTKPPPLAVIPGFRVTSGDVGVVAGVEVAYRVDGKTVRELFDHTAFVCIQPRRCSPPADVDSKDWERQIFREVDLVVRGDS